MPEKRQARRARRSPVRGETPREQSESERRDRAAERLRKLIKEYGPSQEKFADRCGLDPRRVSEWLQGGLLKVEALRAITDKTGASPAWLLGYDVPQELGAVMRIGDLANELRAEIGRRWPHGLPPGVTLDSTTQLVTDVVDEWWQGELERQRGHWAGALDAFCTWLLDGEIEWAGSIQPHGDVLRSVRHSAAQLARDIRSPSWQWPQMIMLGTPAPLDAHMEDRTTSGGLVLTAPMHVTESAVKLAKSQKLRLPDLWQTPFLVAGGLYRVGIAIRTHAGDFAWYLDEKTLEPKYKSSPSAGPRDRGRFLVKGDLSTPELRSPSDVRERRVRRGKASGIRMDGISWSKITSE